MNEPWYQNGLAFRCTRCGHCCTGESGYVWVTDEEIQTLANHLGEPFGQTRSYYAYRVDSRYSLREKSNGDCIFYDRVIGCTVYEARPRQCRTWPFWESNVVSPEAWDRTCTECPGTGQSELISADEITARINVVRL